VKNNTELARRLSDVPLFARCTQRDLRILARHAQVADVRADRVIVRQGDRADAFYLLLHGSAIVARDGNEAMQLQPGDFFGELALLDPAPRAASVIALTDARLAVLGERMFKVVLRDLPHLSAAMLGALAGRLRAAGAPTFAD
jgi:CRP/FNR family transcriptional regulator, cyclic AMP receptor protein